MSLLELPSNPIELAAPVAEKLSWKDGDELQNLYEQVAALDDSAEMMGFLGNGYFVQSARMLLMPDDFVEGEPMRYGDYYDLMFEGKFAAFSHVQVGKIIGARAVSAVCAIFEDVLVVPTFKRVPPGYHAYVPVLAVESIDPEAK